MLAADHSEEIYDGCIISIHAPDALKLLGTQATYDESRILGAFQYVYRYADVSLSTFSSVPINCCLADSRIILEAYTWS